MNCLLIVYKRPHESFSSISRVSSAYAVSVVASNYKRSFSMGKYDHVVITQVTLNPETGESSSQLVWMAIRAQEKLRELSPMKEVV